MSSAVRVSTSENSPLFYFPLCIGSGLPRALSSSLSTHISQGVMGDDLYRQDLRAGVSHDNRTLQQQQVPETKC
jgi:hypothetical protein